MGVPSISLYRSGDFEREGRDAPVIYQALEDMHFLVTSPGDAPVVPLTSRGKTAAVLKARYVAHYGVGKIAVSCQMKGYNLRVITLN